jgi:photosystem II stability/assembly factor-like uncharacterized protein
MVGFGTLPYKTHATESTLLYQNKLFLPKATPTASTLFSFMSADTTSGAMVGDAGTILKYNSDLFEFELDAASGIVTTEILLSVAFADAANGVAVGHACTILAWDGVSWTLSADSGMLPNVNLYDVYHFGSLLIACGYDTVTLEGVILHKGWYIDPVAGYVFRANWAEVYRSSDIPELKDIDAYTAYNIICGGSTGKYVESADWGNTWSAVKQTPITGYIQDFAFCASDYGFAVSTLGEIIKWDGTSWTLLPSPTSIDLQEVMPFSKDFALAVGNAGVIIAWDGEFWREYTSPTGLALTSVFGISANFCWICGVGGYIAQFQSQTYPSLLIDSAGNAMGGHGKVIGKVEGSENVPIKQVADGTLAILSESDEEHVIDSLEIRDVLAHNSSVSDCKLFNMFDVFVVNGLDQQVGVQVKGNRINDVAGAVDIGASFNVATLDSESRTVVPDNDGWLPYIFFEVTAAVLPAAGDIDVYIIKKTME